MILYVYSMISVSSYVVVDRSGLYCSEFDEDEMELLNEFAEIKGFYDDRVEISVMMGVWRKEELVAIYQFSNNMAVASLPIECEKYLQKGYLIVDNENMSWSSVMPKMMYGVTALVTDQGSLVYSNMKKDIRIRLSDFCKSIQPLSLRSDTPIYVLDDKLESIRYTMIRGTPFSRWRFDIRDLKKESLMMKFREMRRQYCNVTIV